VCERYKKVLLFTLSGSQWDALNQHTVDAPSINAFKWRLDKLRQTTVGFLWISPLSPRLRMIGPPLRPHKVRYKERYQHRTQNEF